MNNSTQLFISRALLKREQANNIRIKNERQTFLRYFQFKID